MTLEKINKLEIAERIEALKKRIATLPNTGELLSGWDADKHDVMLESKRPKVVQNIKDRFFKSNSYHHHPNAFLSVCLLFLISLFDCFLRCF